MKRLSNTTVGHDCDQTQKIVIVRKSRSIYVNKCVSVEYLSITKGESHSELADSIGTNFWNLELSFYWSWVLHFMYSQQKLPLYCTDHLYLCSSLSNSSGISHVCIIPVFNVNKSIKFYVVAEIIRSRFRVHRIREYLILESQRSLDGYRSHQVRGITESWALEIIRNH